MAAACLSKATNGCIGFARNSFCTSLLSIGKNGRSANNEILFKSYMENWEIDKMVSEY